MGTAFRMLQSSATNVGTSLTFGLFGVGMLLPASDAEAGTVSIPVSQDVTVNRANPLSNLNSITGGGGLLVGLDDTGSDYSFYLKFALPVLAEGETVSSAKLVGFYNTPIGVSSRPSVFARFVDDDSWNELTLTQATGPVTQGDVLAGLETFGIAEGAEQSFSDLGLAEIITRESGGDGTISLKVETLDGRFDDLQNFSSHESGVGGMFRLELEVSGAKPIPLPPALFSVAGMLPVGALYLWKRRRSGR